MVLWSYLLKYINSFTGDQFYQEELYTLLSTYRECPRRIDSLIFYHTSSRHYFDITGDMSRFIMTFHSLHLLRKIFFRQYDKSK